LYAKKISDVNKAKVALDEKRKPGQPQPEDSRLGQPVRRLFYSLQGSSKLHDLNPFIWFRDTLFRIGTPERAIEKEI
jgi:hypothetical protein